MQSALETLTSSVSMNFHRMDATSADDYDYNFDIGVIAGLIDF